MKYVFEDDGRDVLSTFFRKAYPSTVSDHFVYARGNGNLYETVLDILNQDLRCDILVYIDMVPGNKEIVNIYRKLSRLSRTHNNRVVPMPIVCAEYYLLCSLLVSNIVEDMTGVDLCVKRLPYFDSPAIQSEIDKAFCKNFEKYCKLLVKKNLKSCARISGKEEHYAIFYNTDCKCGIEGTQCTVTSSVKDKAINYIRQYPCVPAGSFAIVNARTLSISEMWDVHRRLVAEYNEMTDKFRQADVRNMHKYINIRPIDRD